jgi:gamma-glutamyltranspeptidase/glutathione hydrolase
MAIQDAINAPRLSVTGTAPTVSVDPGYPAATLDVLRALGYTVPTPADIGSVQAVLVEPKTGKQYGGADPRREGTVIGLPRHQAGK